MNAKLGRIASVGAILAVLVVAESAEACLRECGLLGWRCCDTVALSVDVRLEGYQQQDVQFVETELVRRDNPGSILQVHNVADASNPSGFRVADFAKLLPERYTLTVWLYRYPRQLVGERPVELDLREDFAVTVILTNAQGSREEAGQFTGFAAGSYASWLSTDLFTGDHDDDGVPTIVDECSDTPAGTAVNTIGCSQEQFCNRRPAVTSRQKGGV